MIKKRPPRPLATLPAHPVFPTALPLGMKEERATRKSLFEPTSSENGSNSLPMAPWPSNDWKRILQALRSAGGKFSTEPPRNASSNVGTSIVYGIERASERTSSSIKITCCCCRLCFISLVQGLLGERLVLFSEPTVGFSMETCVVENYCRNVQLDVPDL